MIFYRTVNIVSPEFNGDKKIFVLSLDDTSGKYITTKMLIDDKEQLSALSVLEGVKVAVLPGKEIPLIVLSESTGAKVSDITGLYNQIETVLSDAGRDDDNKQAVLKNVIGLLIPRIGEKTAPILVAAMKMQYVWETEVALIGPLKVDVVDTDVDLRENTIRVLDDLNSKFVSVFQTVDPQENFTRFQDNCESEFFIELPNRLELQENDVPYACMPKMSEVCNPYAGHEGADNPSYRSRSFSSYVLSMIEGNKANNTQEVFANEKLFETALTEWVQYNIREDFGNADGGVVDSLSQEFLLNLASTMYMWHWRHCPLVPAEIDTNGGEDDDSIYVFRENRDTDGAIINAVIILREYLKMVSAELGYKALISAVIQVSRWGTRKPTAITFDNLETEFVLGQGLVKSKQEDLSKYHSVEVDGHKYAVDALIYDSAVVKDTSLGITSWEFPVGVVLANVMENDTGAQLTLKTYAHFVDLIGMVREDAYLVAGFEVVNGRVVTTLQSIEKKVMLSQLIREYENLKDSFLQFPFYRSKELVDVVLDLQIKSNRIPTNLLSVMSMRVADPSLVSHAKAALFRSNSELMQMIASGAVQSKVTALELAIANALLPIYKSVASKDTSTFVEVVDAWDSAVGDTEVFGWYGKAAAATAATERITAFDAEAVKAAPAAEIAATVRQVLAEAPVKQAEVQQDAAEHAAPQQAAQSETKPAVPSVSWLRIVPEGVPLCKVEYNDEIICYCYREAIMNPARPGKPTSRYTLVSNTDGREITDTVVKAERIIAFILHNIFLAEVKGSKNRQVFFEDGDVLNVMKTYFNKLAN